MKRFFTLAVVVFALSPLFAQDCGELFISEYVEGYGNNRALELYNPTNQVIDLSQYSVGRFSNGMTEFTSVQIPSGNFIQPYDVFVIVIDKRDSLGTGLETPIWNGYQVWDVCTDIDGNIIIDQETGDTVYCVQYDSDGVPLIGTEYHDFLDLEGKGDVFLTPVYNINNALYWNGNDAVALIKGTEVDPSGENVIDVIGVIGENPENTIGQPAWLDDEGYWVTADASLVRKPEIQVGTGVVAYVVGDTFQYDQWIKYPKNYFQNLQSHESVCENVSTVNVNQGEVKVYPNPVSGNEITLESPFQMNSIVVFDLAGRKVFQADLGQNSGSIQINLGNLQKGMYNMVIDLGENGMISQKLVK
jgi:hypothetical protein